MKVKELYIKKYHQFENFKLDLTYPEGHKKAGQPLDKVCFIGQSGTGKTSLLELIKFYLITRLSVYLKEFACTFGQEEGKYYINRRFQENIFQDRFEGQISIIDYVKKTKQNRLLQPPLYLQEDVYITNDNYEANFRFNNYKFLNDVDLVDPMGVYFDYFKSQLPMAISYSADFDFSKFNYIEEGEQQQELLDDQNTLQNIDYNKKNNSITDYIIEVNSLHFKDLWTNIREKIVSYREQEIAQRVSMSEKIQSSLTDKDEIIKVVEHFEMWQKVNVNPIIGLAELLNKILNRFNLQVRTKLDFQKTEDISTLKIETLQGEDVSNAFLSTGTKQFILSSLPLYSLKPENVIIISDEPERSFYPDIQKEIVDIYTSLTTDCQFFYATHSPIIASSFEPWEIVELKFNPKTGKVYQELYYEGERHVDNYTINPQYLRWDDILQRVFDLDSEGNEKRVKALMKLATLESKLKNKNLSTEEREILWNEYLKLSKLTGWTTRITDEKN